VEGRAGRRAPGDRAGRGPAGRGPGGAPTGRGRGPEARLGARRLPATGGGPRSTAGSLLERTGSRRRPRASRTWECGRLAARRVSRPGLLHPMEIASVQWTNGA
jgi:hypothetical protein